MEAQQAVKRDLSLGIDVGSTTTKLVLMDGNKIIYEKYKRHFSKVRETTLNMLEKVRDTLGNEEFTVAVSGSAGLGLAEVADVPFVQEVYATGEAIAKLAPDTGVVIELGGEDAKVIF